MASLYSALIGLRNEIEILVGCITPVSRPRDRYRCVDQDEQGEDPEDKATGIPRRFYVEYLKGRRETFGSAMSLRRIEGNVVVGYPLLAKWDIETQSDAEEIARALDAYSPTTAGICFVKVLDEQQSEQNTVGDDYRWVRTKFYAEAFIDE